MRNKTKAFMIAILTSSIFSLLLISVAAAAGSITATPTAQAPGSSISVAGTGFGATKAVGIGFGAEAAVTNEPVNVTGSGLGPFRATFANRPIKPGTFVVNFNINNGLANFNYTENGTGVISSTASSFSSGTIDYATGQLVYYTTIDPAGYTTVRTAFYTSYQYNVTPAAGVNTSSLGAFSANITVPGVANGNYNVTAIDAQGNIATATVNVNSSIPEVLPLGVIVLLSAFAVVAGSRYFRKPPRIPN